MSETPFADQPLPISWVSRIHTSWYDFAAQQAVTGWDLKFTWLQTGSVLNVKLPDASYTADAVARAIRAAGAQDERIHALAQPNG